MHQLCHLNLAVGSQVTPVVCLGLNFLSCKTKTIPTPEWLKDLNEMIYMKHLAQNQSSANEKGIHRDKKRGRENLKVIKRQ